jgi:hypothetical protein
LPDAKVKILCVRTDTRELLFTWAGKCNVPIQHVNKLDFEIENWFKITPDVMAVSTYDSDNLGPETAKSDKNFTFISYLDGCGKFVLSKWIDNMRSPFAVAGQLFSDDIKLNEYRILKLWEKCSRTYNAIV